MSRAPSVEQQLRNTKRELSEERARGMDAARSRDSLQRKLTEVSKDRDEWKARFDALLARVPKTEPLR